MNPNVDCQQCGNSAQINYCWPERRPRICVGLSNDYALLVGGHLQSPVCMLCNENPALFRCYRENLRLCYHCFNAQACVADWHTVVIGLTSHLDCHAVPGRGPGGEGGDRRGPGDGDGRGPRGGDGCGEGGDRRGPGDGDGCGGGDLDGPRELPFFPTLPSRQLNQGETSGGKRRRVAETENKSTVYSTAMAAYTLDGVNEETKAFREAAKQATAVDSSGIDKYKTMLYPTAMTVPAKAIETYLEPKELVEEHAEGSTEHLSEKLLPDLHPAEQKVNDLNETLLDTVCKAVPHSARKSWGVSPDGISPILQLPHFSDAVFKKIAQKKVKSFQELQEMSVQDRSELLTQVAGLSATDVEDIEKVLEMMTPLSVGIQDDPK